MATIKASRIKEFEQYWTSINKDYFASPYILAYDSYFEGMKKGLILAGANEELVEELMGSMKEYTLGKTLH